MKIVRCLKMKQQIDTMATTISGSMIDQLLSGGIHYLCALLNIFFLTLTTVLMCFIFSNATEETKEREKVTKEIAGTHGDGLRLPRSHRNKPQRHNQSLTQQHALTQW